MECGASVLFFHRLRHAAPEKVITRLVNKFCMGLAFVEDGGGVREDVRSCRRIVLFTIDGGKIQTEITRNKGKCYDLNPGLIVYQYGICT